MTNQANKIRAFLLKHLPKHPNDIVANTMKTFNVSRTTVLRHLQHLIKAGQITKSGNTKQITYVLVSALKKNFVINLNDAFDEFEFFNNSLSPLLKTHLNINAYDICEYGITEMLNNCKDHSHGSKIELTIDIKQTNVYCTIKDNGVGLLQTLRNIASLHDPRDIIFELSKGKLTRDPANHTGEGIFFTSRAFDVFTICANGYRYLRSNIDADWTFNQIKKSAGTFVELEVNRKTERKLTTIFKQYMNDDFAFAKTDVIIELAKQYGERLISRSQAKRVVRNLENFSHVTLDFQHIEAIGQGFVDQLFRIYQKENPNLEITHINANSDVAFMIKRGLAT